MYKKITYVHTCKEVWTSKCMTPPNRHIWHVSSNRFFSRQNGRWNPDFHTHTRDIVLENLGFPMTSDWKMVLNSPEASPRTTAASFPPEKHMHQEEHSRSPGQNSEASCRSYKMGWLQEAGRGPCSRWRELEKHQKNGLIKIPWVLPWGDLFHPFI